MKQNEEIVFKERPPQFELEVKGELAYLGYSYEKDVMALMHTFVPEDLRGKNIASKLAKFAFDYARKNNIKVKVYCSFVDAYLKRHPENLDVVVK